jgi:hypothetical protein
MHDGFALGGVDFIRLRSQPQRIVAGQRRLASILLLDDLDIGIRKKLLRPPASRSAVTVVAPIDLSGHGKLRARRTRRNERTRFILVFESWCLSGYMTDVDR